MVDVTHGAPTWPTFYRPPRRPHSYCDHHDLQCECQGHTRCRSRSVTYATCPERHPRCNCSRHHYFSLRHLPRPATVSSLCPTTYDVTSASPVDTELLPGFVDDVMHIPMTNMDINDVTNDARQSQKATGVVLDVTDDVTRSRRTNHRLSNTDVDFNDVSEVTWPADCTTPTHLTTRYSLRRY